MNSSESGQPWDWTVPKPRLYPRTESGRRARGQLEDMVDRWCKAWLVKGATVLHPCTARWLAEVTSSEDGKPTSQGSVRGILLRWRDIGYADIEEDPTRFVGFTVDGMRYGYEEMYRRADYDRRASQPEEPGS